MDQTELLWRCAIQGNLRLEIRDGSIDGLGLFHRHARRISPIAPQPTGRDHAFQVPTLAHEAFRGLPATTVFVQRGSHRAQPFKPLRQVIADIRLTADHMLEGHHVQGLPAGGDAQHRAACRGHDRGRRIDPCHRAQVFDPGQLGLDLLPAVIVRAVNPNDDPAPLLVILGQEGRVL